MALRLFFQPTQKADRTSAPRGFESSDSLLCQFHPPPQRTYSLNSSSSSERSANQIPTRSLVVRQRLKCAAAPLCFSKMFRRSSVITFAPSKSVFQQLWQTGASPSAKSRLQVRQVFILHPLRFCDESPVLPRVPVGPSTALQGMRTSLLRGYIHGCEHIEPSNQTSRLSETSVSEFHPSLEIVEVVSDVPRNHRIRSRVKVLKLTTVVSGEYSVPTVQLFEYT